MRVKIQPNMNNKISKFILILYSTADKVIMELPFDDLYVEPLPNPDNNEPLKKETVDLVYNWWEQQPTYRQFQYLFAI